MNRHNSHQQPEATANDANAKQWQVDLPEQDTGKVGNDSDVGGANDSKNANDTNLTSDQGEAVEVRVIKDSQDESDDRPGQVEQGGQAGRAVRVSTETQPKKRGIIELLGSSPLGVMAQTALDSVRHSVHEIQVDRQIKLIDKTAQDRSTEEQERCSQLNRLVDEGRVKLQDGRVLKEYLSRVSYLDKDGSNTNFINKLIQENKVDLSRPDVREAYLKVALSTELNSERLGVQEAINTGKLDLSNEEIADQFLGAMSQSVAFNTSMLKESSISPERIVNNDHIQEIAVEQMVSVADRVHNGKDAKSPIFSQYWYQTVINGGAYLADVLEKVCSSEEGRQCLVDSINKSGASVQELGEPFEKMETDILEEIARRRARIERGRPSLNADLTEDTLSDVDELFANMATDMTKYNDVLKGLGWEPFKEDESLAKLFCTRPVGPLNKNDKMSIEIQDGACKLGLITSEVTDRLYNYQFKELFNATKRGSILECNDNSSAYAINPDLVPSGEDVKASYWHEQSKLLGDDAMRLCMATALDMTKKEQAGGRRLDLSDLIDEKGILKDTFFQNRPGSLLWDVCATKRRDYGDYDCTLRSLEFLEAHQGQASEMDGSKATIKLLSKMRDEDGRYNVEAVRLFRESMGSICVNNPEKLFDGDEPTDKFYSTVFMRCYCNKDTDKFMSYIDSDWKDHYGDTGRKYLELVSTYPSWSDTSSDERTEWIENYLDAGGPTNELFDKILLDRDNIAIFREHPEWQAKLADDKKALMKFFDECGLGSYDIHKYELIADNLPDYFNASGPTSKMINKAFFDITDFLYKHPELQEGLSAEQKSMVRFCEECNLHSRDINRYELTADSLSEHFNADGPTSKMKDKILFSNVELLYKHPELQEGLSAEQKSMVKFCGECDFDNWYIRRYGLTADNLSEHFNADGPTSKMKDKILFSNVELLYKHLELQEGLLAEQKSMVRFCGEYSLDNSYIGKCGLTPDNLTDYFDTNGPKPKFWQDTFLSDAHNLDLVYEYYQNQDEAGKKRMGLDSKQIAVARGYSSISEGNYWNDSRKLFESYVREHYDELTIDQIKWTASIMARLASSNASELAERSEAFTRELLKLDADKIPEALDRIEDIYIHNHLPYVGKNYLVFHTMHPSDNLEDDFNFSSTLSYDRPNTISPVLQQATGDIRSGKLDQMLNSRDAIIISDLLRASLGSNNRSIGEYLATLKNGQALLDQLSSGELDWGAFNQPTSLMDKDTKANYDTLSTFAWHLATIYSSTRAGKEHPYQLVHQQVNQQSDAEELSAHSNALQTDFANLTSLIKPNSRYTLADRAVRYFAHFVGIEDLAGAERYMDNIVKEADARNRKTAEYLATTSEPKLQPGDLVKGMGGTDGYGIRYLSYAFQNGSISKEYLGDASRSDTTPLDADASIVLYGEQTINQTMASMLANGYGWGLWTVLRSDEATGEDRFIITRRDKSEADQSVYDLSVPDANFDRTNLTQEEIDRRLREIAEAKRHRREGLPKLEIFATSVDGEGHYGIRTGFGMNTVDFFISDKTTRTRAGLGGVNARNNGEEYTLVSEVTKLEIALGGFYIPIVDRDSEELIFTPADYDKMRQQMSGLSYYHTGDYQFAPDSDLELGELTLDKKSLSAVSTPTTSSANSSSSSTSDDAQGASSGSITIPGTDTIINELPASMAETDHKHEVINQVIKQAITSIPDLNLSYKDYLDGDLTENIVEMIDTGSTGRQTNAPGSGDFDYLARLDRSILNDPTKKQQITDALLTAFGRENDGSAIVNGNLRLKQVSIDGLAEPVDIDITFTQKTNKVQYSTDMALADRLTNIKQQSEAKYQQVLANIIYAKQFLKAAGAYKPRRSPEAKGIGGLGGVGIENWVLQHGGSFKQAARDFLAVADNYPGFEDFCAHYPVWDYGENHKGIRSKPHDNFVADNMNPEGYERMKEALRTVVG